LEVCQKPVLYHTLLRFYRFNPEAKLILVLPQEQIANWKALCASYSIEIPHAIVAGGKERFFSVKNALDTINDEEGIVAIHDGVRPLVSDETIKIALNEAAKGGAAIPVTDVKESLRYVEESVHRSVDRSAYRLVQTPQCFQLKLIKKAYTQAFSPLFTDDASVAEKAGFSVKMTEGNVENIKITTPSDLMIAAALLRADS